jgi:hypothetical protein
MLFTHDHRMREEWFAYLNELWGPHSIDRFAAADNRQPLGGPHAGRFCSRCFHPEAEWTDAFSLFWEEEKIWVSPGPPVHLVASCGRGYRTADNAQLRACSG